MASAGVEKPTAADSAGRGGGERNEKEVGHEGEQSFAHVFSVSDEFRQERIYRWAIFWKCGGAAPEKRKNYVRLAARGQKGGEGTNVKDKLPALPLREAFSEGGHRFSALADLVENLTVRNAVHVLGIDQARGRGIIASGLRSIAFSGLAVALDTFIQIDGASSG